ncbi:hypothetical protein OSB04_029844 [Centaurea solstitialis]|uniref:F-box domain-containing protein n=1 Tax=Centaurea solstitialis TaxID=347529 RepID=A0AA38W6J8_9ASTR|nr:hypothetical protein OSB04_029844 [Centaurea solstitialis]
MNDQSIQNSVPSDIAFKIASLLQELDLCALGCCSRFWRELCGSDHIWAGLCRDRWPALVLDKQEEEESPEFKAHQLQQQHLDSNFFEVSFQIPQTKHTKDFQILSQYPNPSKTLCQNKLFQGWRGFYVTKHYEMASKADAIIRSMEQCISSESMEVNHYLPAMAKMCAMKIGFKDVVAFFFKENVHALVNLTGLHYSVAWLKVPVEQVVEAIDRRKISDRQICVKWWKLGRWWNGFRLRDEAISRHASLRELAMANNPEVLSVLQRGAIHEVLRVQVLAAKPVSIPWSCQIQTSG